MTEWEKMLSSEQYRATDKALVAKRKRAKQLCVQYNTCINNDKQQRAFLKELLPNAKGLWIEPNFFCDYGDNIYSDGAAFLNHNVTILDGARVTLGNKVLIGPGCVLAATTHPTDPDLRQQGFCVSKPITIGENAWIGANVTILGGVNIGERAIIGAGVVVKEDIGADCKFVSV